MGCLSTPECTYLPTYLPTFPRVQNRVHRGSIQRSARGTVHGGQCATQLHWWRLLRLGESCNIDLSQRSKKSQKKGVPAEASTTTNITNTQPTCRRPMSGSKTGRTSKHVRLVGSLSQMSTTGT